MILGVIPARFGSTRLMGKPLAMIGDKPMIQHTYESALKSSLIDELIIAVDDEKLFETIKSFGGKTALTPKELPSGSDRIAHVAKDIPGADIIVNIQGDEPFIPGKMIDQAIQPLVFDDSIDVSTLAKKIDNIKELNSFDIPKVVFDYNNFALYFSRATIPHLRNSRSDHDLINLADVYKHIGLYVFRREALFKFTSIKPTDLERTEKLEQLRMLESGMEIKVVVTEYESISVDTPLDLENARNYYLRHIKK
jgi:3-deoxy-manno-octulosonate cytidylyltransferase (CMP-KDO synthetase)